MRIPPSLGLMSLAALAGAVCVVCDGQAAESKAKGTTASQTAAAKSPAGPATLRSLTVALATQDREQAGRLTWRLLAAMARAKGFLMVSATPLTRSSYHADADFAELRAARRATHPAVP